ncbi:helix-hairpin-helix domain-containing protein [Halococcus sp. IIIV-5B]|uniref:helix-hairpin-helix domain-containing protein n=1 Tax=Halococcus sp. IIIV-5B TaxID=2321230 RepID=UPI001314898F|nr:helix-hairpin-helix domain-containing protein [Halococcus sp. IIIV-5B]
MLLILLPSFLFLYVTSTLMGMGLTKWTGGGTVAIGGALYGVIYITPWYNTPIELMSRWVSYIRSRTRMPLVEDEAAEVPGIVDVYPDYQAIELDTGELAAAIRIPLVNTSQLDHDGYLSLIQQYATAINSTIGRDAGTGFSVKIHISQTIPEAGQQVEGLREAARNGVPVEKGGLPSDARKYAEAQAEQTIDLLDENEVMEREVHIITSVKPSEANGSDTLLDRLSARTSMLRPSGETYDAQAALLDNRMTTVENSVQGFSNPQRLDASQLVQLQRKYWLDADDGFNFEEMSSDGPIGNPDVEIDAEPHDERSEPDPEQEPEAETETSAVEDVREQLPLIGSNEDGPNPSTGPSEAEKPPENDDEDDEEGIRKWVSTVATSLRGHVSEASRDELVYSPATIEEHIKHAEVDDQYTTTVWVTGWPKHPDPGLLEDILSIPGIRYDISLSLGATDYHSKLDSLASTRERITNSAIKKEESGKGDVEDATALAADIQVLREQMQEYDAECWEVGMTITVRADSEGALNDARRRITSRCSAMNISTTVASNRQLAGLQTTSPTPSNALREETRVDTTFDMTSDGVACLFPYSGYYPVEPTGTIYGLAKTGVRETGDPLGILQADRLHRTAPHRFWVGRSGSGKSFDVKNHIIEEMVRNPTENTVIVDIARGFDGPVEAFNGSKIKVGDTTINPFEIRPPERSQGTQESLDDKVRLVTDMFQIYMSHNAPEEQAQAIRSTISTTVRQTYKNAGPEDDDVGITNDPETHSKKSPTMENYFDTLAEMSENPSEYTYKNTQSEINALEDDIGVLLNRLKEFQPNGTYSYFNGESDEDMYDDVVYFDMSDFDNDQTAAKGMIMALITSHAYELAKQTRGHVNLVVDEAHDLFRDAAQADQIESMVRAGRNIGLMFDFISQAGEDFDAGAAKVIAKQCSTAIWRDLGEIDVDTPLEFGLTQEQAALVSGELATGDNEGMEYSEALVDIEGDRYLIERRVSDYAATIADYRETQHGDWEAYLEGKSLEEQEAEKAREERLEAAAEAREEVTEPEPAEEEDESDGSIDYPNVLGSGIAADDDTDTDAGSETDESPSESDLEPAITKVGESDEDGAGVDVTEVDGVGESKADALREAGFETVSDVREADLDDLEEAEGVGQASAERLRENAHEADVESDEDDQTEEPPIPDGSGGMVDESDSGGEETNDTTED